MLSQSAYIPWRSSDPHLKDEDAVPHPTAICEPINLAAAEPPPLRYALVSTPRAVSTMQTETVRRTMQSLDARGAFLLGDATGVGKGRTIAAIVLEYGASRSRQTWWTTSTSSTAARRPAATPGT